MYFKKEQDKVEELIKLIKGQAFKDDALRKPGKVM